MEQWILKIIEVSPILGLFAALWYYQKKDYTALVDRIQEDNLKRETRYQDTIDKLTDRLKAIDDVKTEVDGLKDDVKDIKNLIINK